MDGLAELYEVAKESIRYYDDRGDIQLFMAFVLYGRRFSNIFINDISEHYPKDLKFEALKVTLGDKHGREFYRDWVNVLNQVSRCEEHERVRFPILKSSDKQSEVYIAGDPLLSITNGDTNSWFMMSYIEVTKEGIFKNVSILFTLFQEEIVAFRFFYEKGRQTIVQQKIADKFLMLAESTATKYYKEG